MGQLPTVGVIDLSQPQDEVSKAVKQACTTSGFFLISNHGVPEDIIQRHFAETKKFFDVPDEEKAKIKVNKINRSDHAAVLIHAVRQVYSNLGQGWGGNSNGSCACCVYSTGAGTPCSRSRWTPNTRARATRRRACTSAVRSQPTARSVRDPIEGPV